jgi:hypothetical protein
MPVRRRLLLGEEPRSLLVEHRDHDSRPSVRERCSALLKVADGLSPPAVARSGLLRPRDPDTLYSGLELYQRAGRPGLLAHQQGGYRRHRL